MKTLIDCSKSKLSFLNFKPTILFSEGWNSEIQKAAIILKKEGLIEPMLVLNNISEINSEIENIQKFIISEKNLDKYAQKLFELRKNKGLTIEEAKKLVTQPNYLSAVLLKLDEVHGVVCGIEYTTKDTLKPALQIIKNSKHSKIISSALILEKEDDLLVFGDCSLILNPTSEEMVEISRELIKFVKTSLCTSNFNTALLSYSTNGSGIGDSPDKVRKAFQLIKADPELKKEKIYGEIQFDAAYTDSIRIKKAPNCEWKRKASIYVFPNLDSGNIGYKILERCGRYLAVGPIIIGLDKPMNDLSRGASAESVVGIAYVTASQVKNKEF